MNPVVLPYRDRLSGWRGMLTAVAADVRRVNEGGRDAVLLDIGAGPTDWLEQELGRRAGAFVVDRIDVAPGPSDHPAVRDTHVGSVESMHALASASYDAAFANFVYEHVIDTRQALHETARVLRPGGLLAFTVPNPRAPEFLVARAAPPALQRVFQPGGFDTTYAYGTVGRLLRELGAAGFAVERLACSPVVGAYFERLPEWLHCAGVAYDRALLAAQAYRLCGEVLVVARKRDGRGRVALADSSAARAEGRPPVKPAETLRFALRRARSYGRERYCPLCRSSLRRFEPFGDPPRKDVVCPVCGAFHRHRFAWRLLGRRGLLEGPRGLRLLHVAPEAQLERALRGLGTLDYVSTDLTSPRATVRADLTALPFADGSFDAVFCSHVLEHVEDDRRAMAEIRRVTRPSGWALFMVPLFPGETIEDPAATTPAARLALYGKSDHVRMYGELDFPARLRQAGYDVEVVTTADVVSEPEARREGIPAGTRAFLAR